MLDQATIARQADRLQQQITDAIAERRPRDIHEAEAIAAEFAHDGWEVRIEEAYDDTRFHAFVLSYNPHR